MTKILQFKEIGGVDQLQLVDVELASPGKGEVLVDVKAAGLNRAEYLYLHGQYLVAPKLPSRIGVEGSGVIEALGPDVSGYAPGDEVCITPNMSPDRYGVVGEKAIVPVAALAKKPKGMSFDEAAGVWMAYPTAYGGLVEVGGLQAGAGQAVVISAASSSVGYPAIQIAKAHGATVIATSRTSAKAPSIRAAGADHVIATEEENFGERVREITDGKGFDIAFDPIAGPFLQTLGEAAANEATIVEYGALSMTDTLYPLFPAIGKGLRICGFHLVWNLFSHPDRTERAMAHLLAKLDSGEYRPVIDRVFPLAEAADAYRRLESNQQEGKIVVRGE
ncbi:MAG: zinc-dependent alcohol dehydrogenase family protein [Myxococcales bacterium]|nr:zinc-dependent alcohol dehydrogenase family protein [Myxococcales bacterium]